LASITYFFDQYAKRDIVSEAISIAVSLFYCEVEENEFEEALFSGQALPAKFTSTSSARQHF
jgi:hypothetical protein